MAQKLAHIGVTSIALMAGSIHAIFGFIVSLVYILFFALFSVFLPRAGIIAAGAGIIMMILLVIGGFIVGFIWAAIFAIVYNLLASKIGGIEVELK